MSRLFGLLWLAPLLLAATSPGVATAQLTDAETAMVKHLDKLAADDKYPLKHDAKRAIAVRADCEKWYQRAGLDIFEKGPQAKAAWAPKARAAMELHANRMTVIELSGASSSTLDVRSQKLADEAVAAGCDDPLVRYLAEYRVIRANPDPKAIAKFRDTVAAFEGSKYGDVFKVYAVYNLQMALLTLPPADPLRKEMDRWEKRFWELYEKVAADPHPCAGVIVVDLAQMREEWNPAPNRTRRQNYEEIAKRLETAKTPKAVRLVVEGRFLSREGWDARGTGLASTVTPEGWKIYNERLAAAKEKFEAAWAADKTRHQTATQMVKLCKDLSLPRDELETWFARAMELNPDNRWACLYKTDRLNPKWGGSNDELAAFMWMCAKSENVDGLIPMTVVDYQLSRAPIAGAGFDANRLVAETFYAKPVVWVPLHIALEALLKANPDDMHTRSLYAKLACVAGRYPVATAQFEKLGGKYEARFFPGKGEYERLAEIAKAGTPKVETLIGKWNHADGIILIEFAKGGTYKMATKIDGKAENSEGTYKLEGNKLTLTADKVDRFVTILKLTTDVLEVTNAMGRKTEFSRVKEK